MEIINKYNLSKGIVIKRPSKVCKSPYMADICIDGLEKESLVHSPSLGCSGLTDSGSFIFVSPIKTPGTRSSHRIEFANVKETWENKQYSTIVCTNPSVAENIIEILLKNNFLKNVKTQGEIKGQVTVGNSRFDFTGTDADGIEFIAEVKTVPVAGPHGAVEKKEKAKMIKEGSYYTKHPKEKIAIFPDGYIKPKDIGKKPQSERANKHIIELTDIKNNTNKRTIMFYVIQRDDAISFDISKLDPIYRENVKKAQESGVELYAIQMKWIYNNGTMIGYLIGEEIITIV
tara:strand:- start:1664 stop:2527 length:864 start_codon:yes stop_codon:yes gene_type:complete